MATATAGSQQAAFTPLQIRELSNILDEGTAVALPALEQAVLSYRRSGGRVTETERRRYQAAAKRHVRAAKRLTQAIAELHKRLSDAEQLTSEASKFGFVQLQLMYPDGYLVPLGSLGSALGATSSFAAMDWTWEASRNARRVVGVLGQETASWREKATRASKAKRGRKVGDRPYLAQWVGLCLARAGVRLTKSSRGAWARTLRVVHEAAGIRSPEDLYLEVANADKALRADYLAARAEHEAKLRS